MHAHDRETHPNPQVLIIFSIMFFIIYTLISDYLSMMQGIY